MVTLTRQSCQALVTDGGILGQGATLVSSSLSLPHPHLLFPYKTLCIKI
jgi:hypothetical protein